MFCSCLTKVHVPRTISGPPGSLCLCLCRSHPTGQPNTNSVRMLRHFGSTYSPTGRNWQQSAVFFFILPPSAMSTRPSLDPGTVPAWPKQSKHFSVHTPPAPPTAHCLSLSRPIRARRPKPNQLHDHRQPSGRN